MTMFSGAFSPMHILLALLIGVLLFGKKLPEVGRMLGKGLLEFKKSWQGLEDEVSNTTSTQPKAPAALEPPRPPQRIAPPAPKFTDQITSQPQDPAPPSA
jgi:sec-independent protein translocase protein TatA